MSLEYTSSEMMSVTAARALENGPTLGTDKAKAVSAEAAETARLEARAYSEVLINHPNVQGVVELGALRDACNPALYLGSSEKQVQRARAWLIYE